MIQLYIAGDMTLRQCDDVRCVLISHKKGKHKLHAIRHKTSVNELLEKILFLYNYVTYAPNSKYALISCSVYLFLNFGAKRKHNFYVKYL